MTFLGVRDGVGLRFTDGALSSIDMGRFGRTIELHEELSIAPSPLGEPLPYLPLESSLDMSDARYRGLDPYSGRQVQQPLAGGQRTISILQGQSVLAAGPADVLLARAHLDVSVPAPVVWRLHLAGDGQWDSTEGGAEAYLARGCSVRVSATSNLAIENGGRSLRVDLPAGASTVEMWIEVQPALSLAPAIIVCASSQVREAAIVASAVGSTNHAYMPILDLSLPPASPDDVQLANTRLTEKANQIAQLEEKMSTVAQQGAQAASGLILPGAKSAEQSIEQLTAQRESLLQEIEPIQQVVLTYSSWSRRAAVVTRLITSLTSGSKESPRLLLLSPYPVDLMADWAVTAEMTALFPQGAASQVSAWEAVLKQAIPGDIVEVVFWNDAQALGSEVWKRLRPSQPAAFFTIPDEPAFYAVGLLDALRRDRALLPRGRAGAQINIEQIQDTLNEGNTSDHAVVVEADRSVSTLVGVLYAHHTGARFYVNPLPQVDQAFERLRAITEGAQREQLSQLSATAYRYIGEHRKEFMQSQTAEPQLKQIAAGLSILELPAAVPTPYSDQQFVQALTTYLTAQQAGAQQGYRYDNTQWNTDFAALEAQVTASVSPYVQKSVASASRVTVFTTGLPYSLAAGWESKTVGMILPDLAAPFVLRSVSQAGAGRPSLSLSLSVDPGLQQRPAPDVPELVDRTITLRGAAASLSNLAVLAGLLPLDAILLHTQGNLDTIVLADSRNQLMEVHASELGAQVRFGSAPVVIYDAPLAWLGMGPTLIEQGAGGFVGALWPVGNGGSEDAVRLVLQAVMAKGQNPAEALHSLPTYDSRTSRAFVYLGTATPSPLSPANAVDGAPTLYASAARLAAMGRVALAEIVYDRLRVLTGEPAADDPSLRAELFLLEADYRARLVTRTRERPTHDAADKVGQDLEMLGKMRLPEERKKEIRTGMWERMAVLEMASENFDRAQELFAQVRDARHAAGQTAGEVSASFLLAVVQERQRQWAAARQTLLEVQAGLRSTGNAVGLVLVSTSLAYVSLPLAMYPDVLGHLKVATQASLALGMQVLSETLVQTLDLGRAMAQMGAYGDLATLARTLAGIISADGRLPESDRTAISAVLTLMQETAEVLQAGLPAEQRESKLAALVEKAQASELSRSLGMDAWILGAEAQGGPEPGAEGDAQTTAPHA